jgi:lysophospholipid acyltransferase (LPLAT)-like uncharacterized protein
MSPPSPTSGVVVPQALRWHGELAAAAGYAFLRTLSVTLRMRWEDPEDHLSTIDQSPVIFALWHNRLILSLPSYRKYFLGRHPHRRLVALISASKDGALLSRLMDHHGVESVRGSSSRRGGQALKELVNRTRRGYDVAITPDGPRGPKYEVQEGVVMLAQLTGLPVVPMSAQIHSKKVLGSWDGFQVPLPFARCDIRMGEPIWVDRKGDEVEREVARRQIQERMMALTTD